MTPHSKAHFPVLAALQDQPKVVLSMEVSRKDSRNKTLLQLCKTTFLKKNFFLKTSLTITQNTSLRESRKHRAEVSASTSFPLQCFLHRPDSEIQQRDLRLNQYALHYVPQILKDFLKNTIGSTIFIIILIIFNFTLDFNIGHFPFLLPTTEFGQLPL